MPKEQRISKSDPEEDSATKSGGGLQTPEGTPRDTDFNNSAELRAGESLSKSINFIIQNRRHIKKIDDAN